MGCESRVVMNADVKVGDVFGAEKLINKFKSEFPDNCVFWMFVNRNNGDISIDVEGEYAPSNFSKGKAGIKLPGIEGSESLSIMEAADKWFRSQNTPGISGYWIEDPDMSDDERMRYEFDSEGKIIGTELAWINSVSVPNLIKLREIARENGFCK